MISIHATFPASLLHFQPIQRSGLFDFSARQGQGHVLEDGVAVSKDGLVYPAVSADLPCSYIRRSFNVAVFVNGSQSPMEPPSYPIPS